jgi:phosphoribosylformimino-5-aminoimidazole carboxamide ribotide isomerase
MLLIPAIDLKDGRCVRLKQGDMNDETVFSDDPEAVARDWVEQGARRLHLVDLNGAVAGKPRNESAIRAIVDAVGSTIPVQVGGGIRDLDTIERYLDDGITYGHDALDLGRKFEGYGIEAVIYTDIGRDGMLTGVNIEATLRLARGLRVPVFASGGFASLQDVERLCEIEDEGVEGAILGRALYEGKIDFREAQQRADELGN